MPKSSAGAVVVSVDVTAGIPYTWIISVSGKTITTSEPIGYMSRDRALEAGREALKRISDGLQRFRDLAQDPA